MDKEDIYSKLLLKLINNMIPQIDNSQAERYLGYLSRLLNSRLNVTSNNETNIINSLLDKVSRNKSDGYNKLDRMQNMYSMLTTKKTLKRRWAVLYLLDRLSQDNNENNNNDSSKILQTIFHDYNKSSNNLYNQLQFNSQQDEPDIVEKKKEARNMIVVNMNKTNKIITEKDIINDLIFIFQGIDGHFINFNTVTNSYTLNSLLPFNDNIIEIVSVLTELGWLYRKVNNFINFFNKAEIPSQFIQSFSFAIQTELNEYYQLISLFKKMNTKIEEVSDNQSELTLKKLLLWTYEPLERLKWIATACEAINSNLDINIALRGIPIISQLYSYVTYCGADKLLAKVLEETSKPLFSIIKNWLLYGELQDPYKEFFVDINEKVTDDEIWTNRYILISKNVPIFFSKNVSKKIFEIGKCVNFIRKYCNEPTYSLLKLKTKITIEIEKEDKSRFKDLEDKIMIDIEDELYTQKSKKNDEFNNKNFKIYGNYKNCLDLIFNLDNDEKMNMNILPYLNSEIDLLHYEINKDLLSFIYNKFKFSTHLQSINRYFLLGQGDMMQYLMDLLFPELKKPATQIYKHNLLSILETAIRASNAQYHEQDCLKKLNIKLMEANTGDTGWDIFLLEYNIDIPLNVIFTKPLLKEYQRLFFFFWKLKRLEFSQDHQIWRNFMTYSHDLRSRFEHLRPYIQKSMLFNQQIIHFVSNLHNYITLEVLETYYKRIVEKLPTLDCLDDLIALHKKFVQDVILQSLLNVENNLIYKKILQIFELIFRFKTAQVNSI